MSLQARTILNLIAGAVAGLLAWALTDLTGWFPLLRDMSPIYADNPQLLGFGAVFGLLLGGLLGIVDALSVDSQRQRVTIFLANGAIGAVGGAYGLYLGQSVAALSRIDFLQANQSPANFFLALTIRATGYAIFGAIVGGAQGISKRSWVITRQGAFGGAIGGAIGGIIHQSVSTMLGSPVLGRLAALAAIGALVGFFVGLVQNLFKQAWIRVVLGRNEGKEYLLAKPVTTIGRSELSDIGLYGDPSIAPTHAVLEALPAQKRHRLRHVADQPGQGRGGPYPPTLVNGQPVTAEQWLADGDSLQIGKRTLLFHEKATRGAAPMSASSSVPPPGSPLLGRTGGSEAQSPTSYIGQELTAAGAQHAVPLQNPTPPELGAVPPMGGLGTRLVGTAGPYAGQSFPLSHAALTLGRATDCDLALTADTSISRRQAEISYGNGRHSLRDLGSANGTVINGRRITDPHLLAVGDLIQIGDTTLRYE